MKKLHKVGIITVVMGCALSIALYSTNKGYATVPGNNTLVSINNSGNGQGGNNPSSVDALSNRGILLSADGNFVAFNSKASNLVDGDTNNKQDVFLRNLANNTVTRVSLSTSNNELNSVSNVGAISATGRYVVYESSSDGQPGSAITVYLRDTKNNTTTDLTNSSASGTGPGNHYVTDARGVSSDGRFVLIDGNSNGYYHLFMLDRALNSWSILDSPNSNAISSSVYQVSSQMSCDGSLIVFDSPSTTLTNDTPNGHNNIFLIDRRGPSTKFTNLTKDANHDSVNPSISCNGDHIGYLSKASNLTSDDVSGMNTNLFRHVYEYDRIDDSTQLVDKTPSGTLFSSPNYYEQLGTQIQLDDKGDAVFAAYEPTIGRHIYIRKTNNTTELITINASGNPANSSSERAVISASGNKTAYASAATDLISSDTNGYLDVFASETGL